VSKETLEQVVADLQNGPDLADLHFDVAKGIRSQWGKTALQLMHTKLCKELDEEYENVAERSEQYLMQLIQERFQHLVVVWTNVQPHPTANSEIEDYEAIEKCMIETKDI
jgi:hypothetical protein